MMEPTKQAVHEYVLARIEKAQVLYSYLIFNIAQVTWDVWIVRVEMCGFLSL